MGGAGKLERQTESFDMGSFVTLRMGPRAGYVS